MTNLVVTPRIKLGLINLNIRYTSTVCIKEKKRIGYSWLLLSNLRFRYLLRAMCYTLQNMM